MPTLNELIQNVHEDLHLQSLTAVVTRAATTAIEHYKQERFWFNEGEHTFLITLSAVMPMPVLMLKLDRLAVYENGKPTDLSYLPYEEFKQLDQTQKANRPTYYTVYGQNLYVNPVPNTTLTAEMSGVLDISCTTTCVWSNEAYDLIFARTKSIVALDFLHDNELVAPFVSRSDGGALPLREYEALLRLKMKNITKSGTGTVKRWL